MTTMSSGSPTVVEIAELKALKLFGLVEVRVDCPFYALPVHAAGVFVFQFHTPGRTENDGHLGPRAFTQLSHQAGATCVKLRK
jgi:hypothetical protein